MFLHFWNLHIMIREKMQKNKNKIFFPAKMTPSWDLVSGGPDIEKLANFFGFLLTYTSLLVHEWQHRDLTVDS